MSTLTATIPIPVIETERLTLKRIDLDAAKQLFQNMSRDEYCQFFGITDADYDRHTSRVAGSNHDFTSLVLFNIYDKTTGDLAGSCNYHSWYVPHSKAEVGYVINEQYRNKGIAKEALAAILKYGFEEMGLNRVEAFISPKNEPSLKLVAHFGFTHEGLLREHYCKKGVIEDSACFSLLKREYFKTS